MYRSGSNVYESDNAIDNVVLRQEIDRRPQVEPRAVAGLL